jgi:hypothetical protein
VFHVTLIKKNKKQTHEKVIITHIFVSSSQRFSSVGVSFARHYQQPRRFSAIS